MTLPRSVVHDYDPDPNAPPHITNSLDKRSYVPGYMSKFLIDFYGQNFAN